MTENVIGRTGGPYLDIEEARAREIKSARVEGREPDFSAENLFPMADHEVTIKVNPSDQESVDNARNRLDELTSEGGTEVEASSAKEAPMSSPVLAVAASTEDPTPSGQVKTEEGTTDSAAVEEEVAANTDDEPVNNTENLTPEPVIETKEDDFFASPAE